MGRRKRDPDRDKVDVRSRRRGVVCSVCDNRPYKIPAGQLCAGCNRRRNTNFCPGCGGLPERVEGKECEDCGTPAGKNPEYLHPPQSHGSVRMDGL